MSHALLESDAPAPASARSERTPPSEQRPHRAAALVLVGLAATLGLGDIAQVNPVSAVVVNAIRALVPLMLGLVLFAALRRRRWPRIPRPFALTSAAWLAVLAVSAVSAPTHQGDAIASLARPASGLLLAWAVYEICVTQRQWLRVVHALALGGFAIAVVAILEASRIPLVTSMLADLHDGSIPIGDVPRVAATLSHPNEAAMLLELTLPLLLAWAWTASPRLRRPLTLAALITLLAIALTFSRAGLIATAVALGLLAMPCVRCGAARSRLLILGVVTVAIPLAIGWASVMDPGLDRRVLAGIDESSFGQPSRTEFWSTAVDMFRDRPLLGVGPDNFRWRFADYSSIAADNLGIHAHDQYLETLADTGILGLVSFAWLIATLMRLGVERSRYAARARDRVWRVALLASLAAWLTHAVLDDFERFWPTSVAFWLILGLTLCETTSRTRSG
jgi:O-antigen ligase